MQGLFTEEPNVIMCVNCDAEFTIQEVSADNGEICFCPFCGSELYEDDEDLNYEEDDDNI